MNHMFHEDPAWGQLCRKLLQRMQTDGASKEDLQMINTHLRIMSDTHRILANDTDYTIPNSSKLNWYNAPYYWPGLYDKNF